MWWWAPPGILAGVAVEIAVVGAVDVARLVELDRAGLTRLGSVEGAAFVIGGRGSPDVDAVVSSVEELEALWVGRVEPFARNVAEGRFAAAVGPPRLSAWDPEWAVAAGRLVGRLSRRWGAPGLVWDHIGSTSVPGLAAKPVVDLQLGVPSLDGLVGLAEALAGAGFVDVAPHAPGSPGVLRDAPRAQVGAGARWDKRLFASADPGRRAILHVREIGSPWWHYTRAFRDLLRADPQLRRDYETVKRDLTVAHAGDSGNDAYTIAKTTFFNTIQDRLGTPPPS
ncbi:dephospho-CoA kinase [Actinokineospora terrae]|uniref:Dephospho-CoA kinase n=1 Tax=Actinokineospora terrae TaxID=155974 RepID=A0A1H9XJB4_9PSEU|nr:dephospho-CoA kinase [Actinokineospora terrae]